MRAVKIIWINGAFGSGKTQTAEELYQRIPNSFIYDPENVGYFLFKNLPQGRNIGDFQDQENWRHFNHHMLKQIADTYDGVVIVPMTVTNPVYLEEITKNLNVNYFILSASKETIKKRLRKRFNVSEWVVAQIDRCITAFASGKIPGIIIDTENIPIKKVAEIIAQECQLEVLDIKRGFFRRLFDQMKYIRR